MQFCLDKTTYRVFLLLPSPNSIIRKYQQIHIHYNIFKRIIKCLQKLQNNIQLADIYFLLQSMNDSLFLRHFRPLPTMSKISNIML